MKKLFHMYIKLNSIRRLAISVMAFFAMTISCLYAQESAVRITGSVYDEEKQPMPGVGVMVAGTMTGTVTDIDGKYAIIARKGQELQFSFLGFKTEIVVVGKSNVINVTMQTDERVLESAVVTALGIKRDEKSIGYAASKINSEAFANATSSGNWLTGLAGEVAGLDISLNNGGSTSRVTLRGESSADFSNNEALFVVDGVPMFNTATTSDAGGDGDNFAIDYGNGTADINPEDIESVTVLKGPAATALYGSSAANGAILITTKSADKQKSKLNVSFSSSVSFQSVNTSPDLQYVYGQGNTQEYYYIGGGEGLNPEPGLKGQADINSFGPAMDGTLYYQYFNQDKGIGGSFNDAGVFQREKTPFINYGDWFKDFFETGYSLSNSLSVSGKINRKNSIRLSLTDNRGSGIVPGTDWQGQNLSMKMNNEFADWFTSEVTLNYRRNFHDSIPTSAGYGSTSIMYSLWCYAPNIDMDWLKNYWAAGKEGVSQDTTLSGGKNNAYFVANECVNSQDRYRLYGGVKLDFKLYKDLTLMVRGGFDSNNDFRVNRQAKSTQRRPQGWMREQTIASMQYTGDFLLRYSRRLPHDLHITASFGGSMNFRQYGSHTQSADNLILPGIYSLTNSATEIVTGNYSWKRQTNSLYGLVNLSWRNSLFLDVTGRNDWSSTLPASNRSYFYPSVSASAVLNELFDFGYANGLINLMKLRASWAQVGHDTNPYRTEQTYLPTGQHGAVKIPNEKRNSTLRPEIVNSWEVGLDLKMFRKRLNLDIAYYNTITKDILSQMPVTRATGVEFLFFNAGKIQNQGVEIAATGTVVKTTDIEFKINANWSLNRNEVLELAEGLDNWQIAAYNPYAYMYASVGHSLTSMFGTKYKRAPKGSYAIDASGKMTDVSGHLVLNGDGTPQIDNEIVYIGDTATNWKGVFGFTFSWRTLRVSAKFDGRYGSHVWSMTNWVMNSRGKGTATLPGRDGEMVPEGVVLLDNGNYRIFNEKLKISDVPTYYYNKYARECTEANFVSNQYLRLREVRIEYSLTKKVLSREKFLNDVTFAVFGNNLYTWSDFPGFDPTSASMWGNALSPGFEVCQMPGTAQYGASVRIAY